MHLLLADRVAPARSLSATLVSVVLHVGLIAVVVATGQRVVDTVRDLIEQSVQYLYPAPKEVGLDRLGLQREAIGSIARTQGPGNPQAVTGADRTGMKAMLSREGIEYAPIPLQGDSPLPGLGDNAFSSVEVDSIALVDPTSIAPEYPQALAARKVEGGAVFRFVIDSTGLVDLSTVRVMSTTHKLFAQAVVEAMPKMKYRPAKVGDRAVRLLVEQAFSFKIQKAKGQIS